MEREKKVLNEIFWVPGKVTKSELEQLKAGRTKDVSREDDDLAKKMFELCFIIDPARSVL